MTSKGILIELINHLERFEAGHADPDLLTLHDFIGYLNATSGDYPAPMRRIEGSRQDGSLKERSAPDNISILLVLMYRYVRLYLKKALSESPVQTAEEFSCLITLMTHESMTKTELINSQVLEKTSGTEIIKRLLKHGLIREFSDPDDRRSVRVAVTAKGREELIATLPEMNKVARIVTGDLSQSEIMTFFYLLKKLDIYHNDVFMHKRCKNLDELISRESTDGCA